MPACSPVPAIFLNDVAHNGGRPRQVDTAPFELGRNLAATPGQVVFRNDLMELIQYTPQTKRVRSVPVLASPPWINKYYVMDLAPGRSFIEWAVQHRRTVFAISYRNPDASMSGVTLDDYLIHGPRAALDVISDITGSSKIDIVGLCLGGALTAMLAAYLTETGDDRIGSVTLLNTLLDYSEPGVLGAFADEQTISRLETEMARTGVMEGSKMAGTFDVLRANDLIFNYVVSNWLMGQSPPAFDILAWNADSTRLPAAMHSFYLRTMYAHNQLAKGEMETRRAAAVAGRRQERHLHRRRGERPHRALAVVVQGNGNARRQLSGTCCPAAVTSRASSTRRGRRPGTRWAAQPGERGAVAGSRGKTQRLVVAGLGILGGRTRRPPWPAAADGQRALSRPRRGAGRLRPRLSTLLAGECLCARARERVA